MFSRKSFLSKNTVDPKREKNKGRGPKHMIVYIKNIRKVGSNFRLSWRTFPLAYCTTLLVPFNQESILVSVCLFPKNSCTFGPIRAFLEKFECLPWETDKLIFFWKMKNFKCFPSHNTAHKTPILTELRHFEEKLMTLFFRILEKLKTVYAFIFFSQILVATKVWIDTGGRRFWKIN